MKIKGIAIGVGIAVTTALFLLSGCQADKKEVVKSETEEVASEESVLDEILFDPDIKEYAKSKIGEEYTNFALKNVFDESITVSDLIGEPFIIEFAQTTCPSCQAVQPVINDLQAELDIPVVLVFDYEDKETVAAYLKETGVSEEASQLALVKDDSKSVALAYDIKYTPTFFYIDSEGIIQLVTVGSDSLENFKKQVDFAFKETSE